MSYLEDTIDNIKPFYEDTDKVLVSYTDWAYLEQDNKHKEWKGKKVLVSRPENLDWTLNNIV